MADRKPKVTTSAGPLDAAPLLDDDLNTALTIPAPQGGVPAWIQFEFASPFTARAISLAGRGGIPVGRILMSDNGGDFRTLVTLPGAQLYRGGVARTFALPETTARFYRIEITGAPLRPAEVMSQAQAHPPAVHTDGWCSRGARVHRWEERPALPLRYGR
jgi:hypothetical protein